MKKILTILVTLAAFTYAGTLTPTGPASYSGSGPITINLNWNWSSGPVGPTAILFSWTASTNVTGINAGSMATSSSKQIICPGTFPQASGMCIIYGVNTTVMGSGAVALALEVAPASGPVTFTIPAAQAVDATGTTILSTGGAVTIPFVNKCDLDASGAVDAKDVTLIAQRISARPAVTPCDFTGDGACDLSDFWVILQAALGKGCSAP